VKTICAFSFSLLATLTADAAETFLGPIPVQYIAPDKELVLDMHRFYQPSGKPDLQFATKDDVDLAFDAASLQLRARVKKPGLVDIDILARRRRSVLTIAVTDEKQTNGLTIYADRLTRNKIVIHATRTIARVSAAFECGGVFASSAPVSAELNNDTIEIVYPPALQAGLFLPGFVRVIATDANGAPSNVMRYVVNEGIGPMSADVVAPSKVDPPNFHWQDAVMYYAFTDRFADGDKSNDKPVEDPNVLPPANYHGGDLRGVRDKIDNGYFESLGVNTVWVAPLNRNPAKAYREYPEPHRWYTGYHGYWPVSSTEIDPHIGTDKDLRELVDHAHKHGLKVIADLVLHHVHEDHPWWKEHHDWFGSIDLPNGKKNLRLWDEYQFTTWFEPFLPSFDFSKDAPVHALIDNSIWWLNTYKLDGFRLDAVKHILPSFWWKFRAALREKVKQPFYLVGETFKDRQGIMQFVGPNMLDGQFDFPLYDQIKDTFGLTKADFKALDDELAASEKIYGKETLMSPLVGNHDKGRFMAYADGDLPDAKIDKEEEVGWQKPPKVDDADNYKKLELAQAFLMSIDGVPMIYYGDEFGMTGAGDPDNRRDMRFGDQLSPDEQHVLENFKKLGAIRKAHPALRCGSRRTVQCDADVYAFVRAYLDDRVAVIFNRGKTEAKIDIDVSPEMSDGDYRDNFKIENGKLRGVVPAQTAVFVTK
jgi:cyclomaltodextrinase / maltogenic alpha-amylase / neopullulanase